MHLHHFDVSYNEGPWSDDDQGIECSDHSRARQEAIGLLADLAKDYLGERWTIAVRLRDGELHPLAVTRPSLADEDRAVRP